MNSFLIDSVIYKSINREAVIIASYNLKEMKPGYKGKFVIQSHEAEKAGKHWDIRIEFPVKSLANSLKKYVDKRPKSDEPSGIASKEPGTVYRSFVTKKCELPTENKKIYLIETEDHPIAYGNFEGEIKEGYGAGNVEIWDKGTFTLLDSTGHYKFVFQFKGKKLKGIYALIRYQKGFLWIKMKSDKKEASAIDYIRPTLPPQLWDVKQNPPVLRDHIRQEILSTLIETYEKAYLINPLKWIKNLYLVGSAANYNYKENGDVDIDIICEPETLQQLFPELEKLTGIDLLEHLRKIIYTKNRKNIAGTTHTYSFSVLEPGDVPISDNVYDLLQNKWLIKPISLPLDFDPDKAFLDQRQIAIGIAEEIDLLIGRIVRFVEDLKKLDQYNKFYNKYAYRRVILRHKLQTLCKMLDNWYNFIWSLQGDAARGDSVAYYPAFSFSANWKEKMIIFKYLARYGYHRCISMLYNLLKDDPYLEIIDQYIPDE